MFFLMYSFNLKYISKEILHSIVKSLKNHYTSNIQKVISVLKCHFFPYKLACLSIQELTKHTNKFNKLFIKYYVKGMYCNILGICFKGTYSGVMAKNPFLHSSR